MKLRHTLIIGGILTAGVISPALGDEDRPATLKEIYHEIFEGDTEFQTETITFANKHFPELMKNLAQMANDDGELAADLLSEIIEGYEHMQEEFEEHDDEEFEEYDDEEFEEHDDEGDDVDKIEESTEFKQWVTHANMSFKSDILGFKIRKEKQENPQSTKAASMQLELKALLAELFVQNIKNQKAELKELEQEVDEMKVYLKKREINKDKIIERRFNELCCTEDDLEW